MKFSNICSFLNVIFSIALCCIVQFFASIASANSMTPINLLLLLDDDPLTVNAEFSPDTVMPFQTTVLTVTITNPSDVPVSGVSIQNILPSGLNLYVGGSSNTCDTTPEVSADTEEYNLTDATIGANSDCVIVLPVNGIRAEDVGTKQFTTANFTDGINNFDNASASLTILPNNLTVTAVFDPDTVKPFQTTVLTVTVTNPSDGPVSGVSIQNILPSGLNLYVGGASNTCDTTPEISANTEEYNLTDATIDANSDCVIVLPVNGIRAEDVGTKEFSTANFTDGTTTFDNASASLTILPADPTVIAAFNPDTVNPGETTDLTVTLSNPNPVPLTNISITNDLPAGLSLDAAQSNNTCDTTPSVNAGSGIYNLTDASIPANSDCIINIRVNGIGASDAGDKVFSTSDFTNGVDTFGNAMAVLTINPGPPTINGSFDQSSLIVGEQGTITYTITNSAPVPLTGVSFVINLPPQLDLDVDPGDSNATCDVTPTRVGSTDEFILNSATIDANSTCTIVVTFTTNTVGSFTATQIGPFNSDQTGNLGTEPLPPAVEVLPVATITGGFDQSSLINGQSGTLTYVITNNAPFALTGVNFNNDLPIQLNLNTTNSFATCDPTPAVSAGLDQFNLTNATIEAGGTCTIVIRFQANGVGSFNTTVGSLTSNEGPAVAPPSISPITLTAPPPVYIVGDFSPGSLVVGQTGALSFTVVNDNAFPLTGVNFSINLPGELDLDVDPAVTNASCDATPTVFGTTDRFTVTDATIAANDVCKITLTFITNTAGTFEATSIGPLTSNETASIPGPPLTSIQVLPVPLATITGGFDQSSLIVGLQGTLSYTITNNAPLPLTGVGFSINLPGELDLDVDPAVTNATCDATPLVFGTTDRFTVNDATIAAGGNCVIVLTFTTNTVGMFTTTSVGPLSNNETINVSVSNPPPIDVLEVPVPTITGGFDQSSLIAGLQGTLSYTITNNAPLPLTGVGFSINLPGELDLDIDPAVTNATCDATPLVFGTTDRFTVNDATIAAGGNCVIVLTFTTNTVGMFTTTSVGPLSNNETINVSVSNPPPIDVLEVPVPTITGGFDQSSLIAGLQGTLSYTITNNAPLPLTGVGFSINLPGELDLDIDPAVTNATCDATPLVFGTTDRFTVNDATIATGGNCVIVLTFTTNTVGMFTTTSVGPFSSSETANVSVSNPPPIDVMPPP